MSEKKPMGTPYQLLGFKLRAVRENRKESLAEVSGAVEIDSDHLERIESGEQRPSEDILLLLLSYFDIEDDAATAFWDLAGYSTKETGSSQQKTYDLNQPVAMLMPIDLRVVYTDRVHIMANNYGVVMNFMQIAGPNNQPLAVARIGMSKEHAQSVLELLQKTLSHQEKTQQLLPDASPKNKQSKNKSEK